MTARFQILRLLAALALVLPCQADAGLGLFNIGSRVGLDVVQGNDTRRFFTAHADIATLGSPRVVLEVSGDIGEGRDLDMSDIEVMGVNAMIKYVWVNRRGNAFAYTGGGIGSSRFRRLFLNEYVVEYDPAIHFVLLGMERLVWGRHAKGTFEVRWILGGDEDNSALRVSVGAAFILKVPE